MRDRLGGLRRNEDFAGSHPPRVPRAFVTQLAMVSVPRFLLGLSDRESAEAVRCRIDLKYALTLELEDPSCHHRAAVRLPGPPAARRPGADRLLDPALGPGVTAGPYRRTAVTHVAP